MTVKYSSLTAEFYRVPAVVHPGQAFTTGGTATAPRGTHSLANSDLLKQVGQLIGEARGPLPQPQRQTNSKYPELPQGEERTCSVCTASS